MSAVLAGMCPLFIIMPEVRFPPVIGHSKRPPTKIVANKCFMNRYNIKLMIFGILWPYPIAAVVTPRFMHNPFLALKSKYQAII
jgi:hypothetical protein